MTNHEIMEMALGTPRINGLKIAILLPQPPPSDFLNWMPSNDDHDDGDAEEIQEAVNAAAASYQAA